ncbi:MAG: hypothetical protein JW927_07470 [Deltaproteobacteria bacterium]|nr:hypothetical protein [Deltaproteobacteria bacterium]
MAKRSLFLIFILLAVIFIAGIYHIFSIRFRIGDIYPHYSSLRSDPMGAKILYEALKGLPGYSVKRDHSTTLTWEGGKNTTLFLLGLKTGLDHSVLSNPGKQNYKTISTLLSSGSRLVISLHPVAYKLGPISIRNAPQKDDKQKQPEKGKKEKGEKDKSPEKEADYSFLKRWGFNIHAMGISKDAIADLALNKGDPDLPASIKFPAHYYFTDLDSKWTVLYALKNKPVIISRQYGGGTIILCADSYIFSNEAMMYDRYPGLLSWFVGQANHIYFDESHFGMQHNSAIIDLAYKYRLQGVFIAFLLIAVLYIWKNGVHFVPPQEDSDKSGRSVKSEKDQLDALVSLLQRYIAPENLLKTCITEWANTTIKAKRLSVNNIPSIKELEVLAAMNDKPSQIYNSICKKLIERKQL